MSNMSRDNMLRIIREAVDQGAVEVHFKVPNRPLLRDSSGALTPTRMDALTPADVKSVVFALCAIGGLEIPVAQISDHEFSFGLNGLGRFRAFIYRQRGSLGAVVRRVTTDVPPLASLGLDGSIDAFVGQPGLVLVSGTQRIDVLHALVDSYNARERSNVVILETPLTYLHRDAMAAISHREVGTDLPDFASGINQAIRLDADLLALGDIETPAAADRLLCAAERRMPVIATVAAPNADQARWWFARLFFGQQRDDVERRLDNQLIATISVSDPAKPEVWPKGHRPSLAAIGE